MLNGMVAYLLGLIALLFWQVIAFFTRQSVGKNILISLFIAYLAVVLAITSFPIVFDVDLMATKMDINLVPFRTIVLYVRDYLLSPGNGSSVPVTTALLQLGGNILLAVPYGVVLGFLVKKKTWWKLLLFAPLLSISIELLQLLLGLWTTTMYRAVDIDDVILNTIGAWIGIGIYYLLPKRVKGFFAAGRRAKKKHEA